MTFAVLKNCLKLSVILPTAVFKCVLELLKSLLDWALILSFSDSVLTNGNVDFYPIPYM